MSALCSVNSQDITLAPVTSLVIPLWVIKCPASLHTWLYERETEIGLIRGLR